MDKRRFLFAKDGFMLYYHAICNLFGLGGVPVDYAKAGNLFLQSAKRGVAEALVGLGWMAGNGLVMSQSWGWACVPEASGAKHGARGVTETWRECWVTDVFLHGILAGAERNEGSAY